MNRFQAIDPKVLGIRPGERLLDVGCGVGRHVLELSREPGLSIGVDWEREDLHRAAYWFHLMRMEGSTQGCVYFMQGGAARLPFVDGAFDRVVCTEVLEHVADDRAVLDELVRVLRPGGMLAISVPDEYTERLLWRYAPRYRNTPGGHVRIYGRRGIVRLLRASGARPSAIRFRHSLESVRWLTHEVIEHGRSKPGPIMQRIRWLLDDPAHGDWHFLAWCDAVGNYILPKSIVVYGRKLEQQRR